MNQKITFRKINKLNFPYWRLLVDGKIPFRSKFDKTIKLYIINNFIYQDGFSKKYYYIVGHNSMRVGPFNTLNETKKYLVNDFCFIITGKSNSLLGIDNAL